MTKSAVIVGSNGQDGTLLYNHLTQLGYGVIGIDKSSLHSNFSTLPQGIDILNGKQVSDLLSALKPDEIYYLATFHHAAEESFSDLAPQALLERSLDINVYGLVNFLEGIRRQTPRTRLFYAASCLVFGNPASSLQDESTPFNPICAYGISKAAGVQCCRFYRDTQGVFAVAGILYNHESPLRKEYFLSRKIVQSVRRIQKNLQERLILGNLTDIRDWGYAPDYVDAMQLLLQLETPEDVVIATGEGHTVREFVEIVFDIAGLDWKDFVCVDPAILHRRQPVYIGSPQRLKELTGWHPSVSFAEMIRLLMVTAPPGKAV